MLKIVKKTDVVEVKNIVVTIYGNPSVGKTSAAFTAEKPFLIDFDNGAYRAANRGDFASLTSWKDVASLRKEDLGGCKTLVVDTVGRALDLLALNIIDRNGKMGRAGGALTLKGYGALKSEFSLWLSRIKSFGMDIILIAHASEVSKGESTVVRMDVQGASRNEIYKVSDIMGILAIDDSGRRIFNCNPTEVSFGKNPGIEPRVFPAPAEKPTFLADIISETKALFNTTAAEQALSMREIDSWRDRFMNADVAGFNDMLPEVKSLDSSSAAIIKKVMIQVGETFGIVYDKDTGSFVQQ